MTVRWAERGPCHSHGASRRPRVAHRASRSVTRMATVVSIRHGRQPKTARSHVISCVFLIVWHCFFSLSNTLATLLATTSSGEHLSTWMFWANCRMSPADITWPWPSSSLVSYLWQGMMQLRVIQMPFIRFKADRVRHTKYRMHLTGVQIFYCSSAGIEPMTTDSNPHVSSVSNSSHGRTKAKNYRYSI